jgi:hypothetical protein
MSDKHIFIPLGAACDSALCLNNLNLRKNSYPFDWLWNLDTGLFEVTKIIKSDFYSVKSSSAYRLTPHYRFEGGDVTAYTEHLKIVHLHSDPLTNVVEHKTLIRRANNFISTMEGPSFKHFFYYRNTNEDILANNANSNEESIELLISEGENFIIEMKKKHPEQCGNFDLMLTLQVEYSELHEIKQLLNKYNRLLKAKFGSILIINCMIARNDSNFKLHLLWNLQWLFLFLSYKNIPILLRCRAFFYGFGRILILYFKKIFGVMLKTVNSRQKIKKSKY